MHCYLPWAWYVLYHRLLSCPYNVYECRRGRPPKSALISWAPDISSTSLEPASKRDTTFDSKSMASKSRIIEKRQSQRTVSSARVSSHVSTSFIKSWSWSSGASAEIVNLCNKSLSLLSSTVSGRSTCSFLALAGSNFLRQRGQIRGLKANRHLHIWNNEFCLMCHLRGEDHDIRTGGRICDHRG